jgi:hypothetical protein
VFYSYNQGVFNTLVVFMTKGYFWGYWEWDCFPDFFVSEFMRVFRKDFFYMLIYILLLCWKFFKIRSKSLPVKSLGSFKYRIISSVNRDSLITSFPICISFSCYIILVENLSLLLNNDLLFLFLQSCFIPDSVFPRSM